MEGGTSSIYGMLSFVRQSGRGTKRSGLGEPGRGEDVRAGRRLRGRPEGCAGENLSWAGTRTGGGAWTANVGPGPVEGEGGGTAVTSGGGDGLDLGVGDGMDASEDDESRGE